MEKKSALDIQIDGQHYKNQKIQPIELAYKLGGTPAFCKLAKYLTREKNDKKVNLQKAFHCICLEEDLKNWAEYHYEYEMVDDKIIEDNEQLIVDFSNGVYEIEQALYEMFYRNYAKAKFWVNRYALKTVGEEVGD